MKRDATVIASRRLEEARRALAREHRKSYNKPRNVLLTAALDQIEAARVAILAINDFDAAAWRRSLEGVE